MATALGCIGLLGLLVFGLGLLVSVSRGRSDVAGVIAPDPASSLYKASRAHGNTVEYAPMLAVLMFILGSAGPSTWVLWCMGLVTLSRYLLVIGILTSPSLDQVNPLRFGGALGTYVFGLALCGALLRNLL